VPESLRAHGAHPLEPLLARVRSNPDFPASARIIRELHAVTRREHCAALDVVRVILDDPGLSSKVLRVVNSAFYRRRQDPISTITRAVIVLGFETIRDVATGIVLLEDLLRHGRTNAFVRDALGRAVHRGLLAQELSVRVGYPTPEEAYLLGLFADWGTLWTSAYFPEEFTAAQRMVTQDGVSLAYAIERVLGVPPNALSAAILDAWHFPPTYSAYFRTPLPVGQLTRAAPETRLFAVVDLATEYAAAPAEAAAAVRLAWQQRFAAGPEAFADATRAAREAWSQQAKAFGLKPLPGEGPPSCDETPAPPPEHDPGPDPRTMLAILGEVTRAILEGQDLNQTLAMVLEGVARCGRFDVVFLALLNPARDHLVGRLGYGEDVRTALRTMQVPLAASAGPLADAVLSAHGHVVPSGSPAPAFPGVRSYVVEPLAVRGTTVGVLVAGRTRGAEVGPPELDTVRLFATHAGLALDRAAR
jgi:hypothetical protein